MGSDAQNPEPQHTTYRLEVEGEVGERWEEWLQAEVIRASGGTTVLEVRAADQSELLGRLRRIHDLNVRVVSLTRVSGDAHGRADSLPGHPGPAARPEST